MLREILKRHISLSYLLFLYFKIFLLSETCPVIVRIKFVLLAFHLQYKIPICFFFTFCMSVISPVVRIFVFFPSFLNFVYFFLTGGKLFYSVVLVSAHISVNQR